MVFCNQKIDKIDKKGEDVTILILIDGFLQFGKKFIKNLNYPSHNPYFNRWFSAINRKIP